MGRVADPKVSALWQKRVNRQPGSGLSVVEYCRREGISTASFYAWKRRLRASRAPAARRGRRQEPNSRPGPRGFVQVPITVTSAIEVCFSDGTKVRVPTEHLAATLKVLRVCRPEGTDDD